MNYASAAVKVVGANGQLSLGKMFAGKMVLVEQLNHSTWLIKAGTFVPESEQWLLQSDALSKLDKALEWADKTLPEDNLEQIARKIKDVRCQKKKSALI